MREKLRLRTIVHTFVVLSLSVGGCSNSSGTTNENEPTAIESIFTVVGERLDRGVKKRHNATPVTVFHTDGDHAYLEAMSHRLTSSLVQPDGKPIDSEFFAILGERGKTRMVPVELMFTNRIGYAIFRGPRDQLPAPVPRRPLPNVQVGDEFNCVWINMANYVEPPYFDLRKGRWRVASLGPPAAGRPAFLSFEVNGVVDHGYLTDEEGRIAAAFHRSDSRSCLATPPGGAVCERGAIQEGRIRVTRLTADELRIDFAVQTFHPFEEGRSFVPRLFINHPPEADRGKPPYEVIQRHSFQHGIKPDAIVEFEKVASIDDVYEMPSPPSDWCRAAHWIGSYRFRESETGPVLWYRFERLGGLESQLLLNATMTESRLFKHPAREHGEGKAVPRDLNRS